MLILMTRFHYNLDNFYIKVKIFLINFSYCKLLTSKVHFKPHQDQNY